MNPARETSFRKTAKPFAVSLTDWLDEAAMRQKKNQK